MFVQCWEATSIFSIIYSMHYNKEKCGTDTHIDGYKRKYGTDTHVDGWKYLACRERREYKNTQGPSHWRKEHNLQKYFLYTYIIINFWVYRTPLQTSHNYVFKKFTRIEIYDHPYSSNLQLRWIKNHSIQLNHFMARLSQVMYNQISTVMVNYWRWKK